MTAGAESKRTRRSLGPYEKGKRRREEIIDRALEVFSERGFEGTSLRVIAERIGVTHTALLHYFPSRQALLVEVLRRRDIHTREGRSGPFFEDMVRIAQDNVQSPGLIALYTSLLGASVDPTRGEAHDFFTERFECGRRIVREALARESPTLAGVDPDRFAALLIAAFDGLQVQWLLDPTVDIAESLSLLGRLLEQPPATD